MPVLQEDEDVRDHRSATCKIGMAEECGIHSRGIDSIDSRVNLHDLARPIVSISLPRKEQRFVFGRHVKRDAFSLRSYSGRKITEHNGIDVGSGENNVAKGRGALHMLQTVCDQMNCCNSCGAEFRQESHEPWDCDQDAVLIVLICIKPHARGPTKESRRPRTPNHARSGPFALLRSQSSH